MMNAKMSEAKAEMQKDLNELFNKRAEGMITEDEFKRKVAAVLRVTAWSEFMSRCAGEGWITFLQEGDNFICRSDKRPATEEEIEDTITAAKEMHIPLELLWVIPESVSSPGAARLKGDGTEYYRLAMRDAEVAECFPESLQADDRVSLKLKNGCEAELEICEIQSMNEQNRKMIWFSDEELGAEEDWIWYKCFGTVKGYTDSADQKILVLKSTKDSRLALIWEQNPWNMRAMRIHWREFFDYFLDMGDREDRAIEEMIGELEEAWKRGWKTETE